MQKVTENYLSKVTRYFYFVTSQHCPVQTKTAIYNLHCSAEVQSNVEDSITEKTEKIVCHKIKIQPVNTDKHKNETVHTLVRLMPERSTKLSLLRSNF